MRLSRQFQAGLFFLFKKRFWAYKKHQSSKWPVFPLSEVFMRKKLLPLLLFVRLFLFYCLVLVWYAFLYAQNFFIKRTDWLEIVLIPLFTILLKQSKSLVAFEQVKTSIVILLALKKLVVIFPGFGQVENSFRINSVNYGTPCHAIGQFVFWCHHVTYRMPCHAGGHLVIYRECYGFEGAFFTLRFFLPYILSCWF